MVDRRDESNRDDAAAAMPTFHALSASNSLDASPHCSFLFPVFSQCELRVEVVEAGHLFLFLLMFARHIRPVAGLQRPHLS